MNIGTIIQTKYASGNTTGKSFTYKIVSIEKNKHEALTLYELENVDSHVRQFVTHKNLLDVCEVTQ
ncbi:hypothetical protein phi9184_ORF051 [Enterococcus phage 9184]|uniref:Uncharacterized protein n=1 Tax=Enterococcus phage 9184 TaxID=2763103 RepID=A0A7L8ZJI1_9CAUD|nr:hypothetical protein phi9184_ORF051 [Enterococcus phage 9184]